MNREAVKKIFLTMDDRKIQNFIEDNKYVFGLEEVKGKTTGQWLAMWN